MLQKTWNYKKQSFLLDCNVALSNLMKRNIQNLRAFIDAVKSTASDIRIYFKIKRSMALKQQATTKATDKLLIRKTS